MSPEQARGREADQRSDVFSFGCVLYEMLTSKQLFFGEEVSDVLAAVLRAEADLALLPKDTYPGLPKLIKRCLEKSPRNRWHAIGDVRLELQEMPTTFVQQPVQADRLFHKGGRLPWAVAGVLGVAVLGLGYVAYRHTSEEAPRVAGVTRFSVSVPEGKTILGNPFPGVSMSPDGKAFAFVANFELYLRSMSELEPRELFAMKSGGGDTRITNVFFSSDGQWIGFYANQDSTLRKIAITGGAAVTLCKARNPNGISWSGDQIVFSQPKGIMRVSANGGEPELIASASSQEFMSDPQLLNDGTAVLFTVTKESGAIRWDRADIVTQSVKSGERKVLVHGGSSVRYVPTGHLVYALGGTLFAVRFDAKKLRVEGGPVPILEGVLRASQPQNFSGAAQFSFSNTGSLIYFPGPAGGTGATGLPPQTLALADRNGKVQPLGLPPQPLYHPRISPDGKQLVFGTDDGNDGIIWVYDLKGNGPARRLTFGGSNFSPIWSRDGRYITFASDRQAGDRGLFRQLADGTAPAERLTKAELGSGQRPEQWSPDGKTLSFIMNPTDGAGQRLGSFYVNTGR